MIRIASNSIVRFRVRSILIFFCFFASRGWGGEANISIDSVKILRATPEYAEVEIVGSYDGSMGQLTMAAITRSKDGALRSYGSWPVFFPIGHNVRVQARISAPIGLEAQRTDLLVAGFYKSDGPILFRRALEWVHVWPELPEAQYRSSKIRQAESKGSRSWHAILETLKEEDFAALNALIKRWGNPNERDNDGRSPLESFGDALSSFLQDKDWQGNFQHIQEWRKFSPKSSGGAVAEALYWATYAWNARGSEYATNVDSFAMKLFLDRMKRAEKILIDSKSFATKTPVWYQMYLDIAIASKRDDRFIEKLFDEGSRKHPYYLPIYLSMANRWAPKSGSNINWQKLDELANKAVALTSELDGTSNYARFYAHLSYQQRPEVDLMWNGPISWPRMKKAFEELVARYPSAGNFNMFAAFACRAGDKNAFLNVRPKVVNRLVSDMWPENYSLDLCDRRFTQQS